MSSDETIIGDHTTARGGIPHALVRDVRGERSSLGRNVLGSRRPTYRVLASLLTLGDVPEWYSRAACAFTDTDAFFPTQSTGKAYALRVCDRCDVRAECLDLALDKEEWGTWGGMSEIQRRRILEARRRERV